LGSNKKGLNTDREVVKEDKGDGGIRERSRPAHSQDIGREGKGVLVEERVSINVKGVI
jgi:hypothetical protein